jgi:hypothetical protein
MNGNDLVGTRLCKMGGNCLYHLPVGELVRQTFCWKCGVHQSEEKMNKSDYKFGVNQVVKAVYINGMIVLEDSKPHVDVVWDLFLEEVEKDIQAILLVKDWKPFIPDVAIDRVVIDKIELDVNRFMFYRDEGYIKCPWAVIVHFHVLTARDLAFGETKGLIPYSSFDNKGHRAQPLSADEVRGGDFAID